MERYIIFYKGTNKLKRKIDDGSILDGVDFEIVPPFNKSVTIIKYEDFRFTKRDIIENKEYAKSCIVLSDDYINDRIIVYARKELTYIDDKEVLVHIAYSDVEVDCQTTPIYHIFVFNKNTNKLVDSGLYTKRLEKIPLDRDKYKGIYDLCSAIIPAKFTKEILNK